MAEEAAQPSLEGWVLRKAELELRKAELERQKAELERQKAVMALELSRLEGQGLALLERRRRVHRRILVWVCLLAVLVGFIGGPLLP